MYRIMDRDVCGPRIIAEGEDWLCAAYAAGRQVYRSVMRGELRVWRAVIRGGRVVGWNLCR